MVFEQYLYSKLKPSQVADIMKREFPVLDRSIVWLKSRHPSQEISDDCAYKQIAQKLQRLESSIIIDGVASEFAQRHAGQSVCLISLHDTLITTKEHLKEVQGLLEAHFEERLGVKPKVKRGPL